MKRFEWWLTPEQILRAKLERLHAQILEEEDRLQREEDRDTTTQVWPEEKTKP